MKDLPGGFRRAFRAWPMAVMLTAFSAVLAPALTVRDRMSAADVGLGGFPFNISDRVYYSEILTAAQLSALGLLFLAWIFLSGGIIDRLARDTRSSSTRFFAACGACVGPLIRLALLNLLVYAAVLRWLEPWLAQLSNGTSEMARMGLFGALATLLFAIALVFDYARVRLVIEDRRSAIGALLASLRLLRAHPARTLGTQAFFWLVLVLWITARALPDGHAPAWFTYTLVAGELLLKLALIGTQVSIYQSTLASAGWVARRDPAWPDEPSANPAAI